MKLSEVEFLKKIVASIEEALSLNNDLYENVGKITQFIQGRIDSLEE